MQVLYKSTRGKEETVTASMAILKGLSEDGGLFVPTEIPCSIGEMNNCNCSAVYYYCQYTEQLRITLERQEISCRYYTKAQEEKKKP